jgi:hypothetical protein
VEDNLGTDSTVQGNPITTKQQSGPKMPQHCLQVVVYDNNFSLDRLHC